MNDQEIKLMKEAILHEYEGEEYYTYQSKQWHAEEVSDNFLAIAKEEQLHAKWLEEIFEAKKEPLDGKLFTFMKDVQSPGLFNWSDIKKIGTDDMKSVFKKAMEMEQASYLYYEQAKNIATDEAVINLYDMLIQWEKAHYHTFKDLYESIE